MNATHRERIEDRIRLAIFDSMIAMQRRRDEHALVLLGIAVVLMMNLADADKAYALTQHAIAEANR